jgi:hypothetical protein
MWACGGGGYSLLNLDYEENNKKTKRVNERGNKRERERVSD